MTTTNNVKASITVFACWMLIACSGINDHDRKPFPKKIENNKRATHKNIPGTRVFLNLPEKFYISPEFKGIEKDHYTRIEVIDLDGNNYYSNTATVSKGQIERLGYMVLEFKELTVNGFPAKIALMRGRGGNRSYSLVFGDSTFTVALRATFNGNDGETYEQVRQALMSVYYDTAKKVNTYMPAIFTLNDSRSIFKFAKSVAGKQIYLLQGVVKDQYKNEPYVVAVNVQVEGLTIDKVADKLVIIPGNYNMGNIQEGTTNGFPSLTREVLGELDGQEVIIFQHTILIGETAVCMQGVAPDADFDRYLEEFKKLTNTVSLKSKKPEPVKRKGGK